MGRQAAVGIGAQHVLGHLGPPQGTGPFPEAQHLHRGELRGQGNAEPLGIGPPAALGLEPVGGDPQQRGQPVAELGPAALVDQQGLEIEVVGEARGGQHPSLAVQQATPHRIARQQADPVLIGHGLVLGPVQQLEPGQAPDDGPQQQQHEDQQQGGLVAHSGMAGGRGSDPVSGGAHHQESRLSSSASRSSMRARAASSSAGSPASGLAVGAAQSPSVAEAAAGEVTPGTLLGGDVTDLHLHHRIAETGLEAVQTLPHLTGRGLSLLSQLGERVGTGAVERGQHLGRPSLAHPLHHRQSHRQHVLHQSETQGIERVGSHGDISWSGFSSLPCGSLEPPPGRDAARTGTRLREGDAAPRGPRSPCCRTGCCRATSRRRRPAPAAMSPGAGPVG